MVIERFGKMVDIKEPGLFFALPVVDLIAYRYTARPWGATVLMSVGGLASTYRGFN